MKKRNSIQLLDKGVMRLEGIAVPYRLKRSRRARHLRLTINRMNEVVLTLPEGYSEEAGFRFMRTKAEWLRQNLRKSGPPESLRDYLRRTSVLAVGGRAVPVRFVERERAMLAFRREADLIEIGWDERRHGEAELKILLRRFASEILSARTRELAVRHGLQVNRTGVRDQVSRWGSCSARRNISLNWRLVLLPPEICDYVIFHELAHLLEMNHSDRFWKVLEGFDPRARLHDRRLSEVTNRIMMIGREAV